MKIGIAQINTTVGALSANRDRILRVYQHFVAYGADLVVFPELAICGYPPRDLLLRQRFLDASREAVESIAIETTSVPALIGFPESPQPGVVFNSVAVCRNQRVDAVGRKCLLPTYDVFDEDRYFTPAHESLVFQLDGRLVGVTVCEDLWFRENGPIRHSGQSDPLNAFEDAGLDLLVNCSASPWHRGKTRQREQLVTDASRRCRAPTVYVNSVGGNDELIFDGQSLLTSPSGEITIRFPAFQECIHLWHTNTLNISLRRSPDPLAATAAALTLGLRDYVLKSGFHSVVIGLSGGIDSAVTATLAVDALGPDHVLGVSLPSAISSDHSRDDAATLARNLGIRYEVLPIDPLVSAANRTLAGLFQDFPADVTEENIQARSRGLLLMALSNKFGNLLLTTGNKSEVAVGYCTLYGDMAGGLAVISDVPKTLVFDLARYLNRDRERIPVNTITKPPSAELRPDQKDEDSLPPYPVLDEILRRYVEENQSRATIIADGFDPDTVLDVCRKVDRNEYKRKQAAPGLKITPLAFGIGRRIPIVQHFTD